MRKLLGLAVLGAVLGCQADVMAKNLFDVLQLKQDAHSFNDTRFDMGACEITPDRSAICKMTVLNQYRDKRIEVSRGITIQDNDGNEYAVIAGGFGTVSDRPKWNQVAVADSAYELTVIASNLSSRATSVRAVVFPRLLVRSTQGQTIGYRDNVIFSNPTMLATPALSQPEGQASVSPSPAPIEHGAAGGSEALFDYADRWVVVGFWNYDAEDGLHLPANGLILRNASGASLGKKWSWRLELKNHAMLRARNRSLWPVLINAAQRKVCADYPDYPSYQAYIDLPGADADGIYQVARCKGA